MKYIVIELQTNDDGTVGVISNSYDSRQEAERQYHLILAAAATSSVKVHSALLLTPDGKVLMNEHYSHGS